MDPINPINSPPKPTVATTPDVQVPAPATPVSSVTPVVPVPPVTISQVTPPLQTIAVSYAGFWVRFAAAFIDGLIIILINFAISFFIGFVVGFFDGLNHIRFVQTPFLKQLVTAVSYAASIFYYVYFIGSRGQTFGKQLMKIKVVSMSSTSNPPGYFPAFLREIVGKFISFIVILLGFFWMLWDPKKQTWHDKIAGTVVIKI